MKPSNPSDEWNTPEYVIERVREVFANRIDLDPASNEKANRLVKAETYFTENTNGLSKEWFGNVFVNPPYSQPKVAQFVSKLVQSYELGKVVQGIALLKEGPTNKWFEPLRPYLTCYLTKRVKFINRISGEVCESPRSGHCMVYIGEHQERFIEVMERDGFAYFPNMTKIAANQ